MSTSHDSVPGLPASTSKSIQPHLQSRLVGLLDLQLALKHVHWNVVGPDFLAVHEMLDEHVVGVRDMVDAVAERCRTLGGVPNGLAGNLVAARDWEDYPLGRAMVPAHLEQVDEVYNGVISDHRDAIAAVADDPVTEDLLIGQTAQLELYQWFVRSFIETASPAQSGGRGAEAGRAPTNDEAAAADAAKGDVDLGAVEEHYREMTKVGAEVQGEGQI